MISKQEKIDDINKALKRVGSKSYAELSKDNRLLYVKFGRCATKPEGYQMHVKLNELLGEMYGEDIRYLKNKWGKQK